MKVNYPETIIHKSVGSTDSEIYLARLCNETFLSLWSFPNIFRDQGRTNSNRKVKKGDGKEVCDLLVIFENHVIIFSDKYCDFPNSGDIELDWSRWYKRAVKKSAEQLYGAERWIFNHSQNLFIDKDCLQQFPFTIPLKENARVHRIIVAHGASRNCIKHFKGSGSLMLNSHIIGDMHMRSADSHCLPFSIGQVDANKGYVHVFDDTSLEIVMKTLDTISDFIRYLTLKEQYILSGRSLFATGEEDLLAYYLQQVDENDEHTFLPDSESETNGLAITEGIWESFTRHPSRLAQIKANEISYSWDQLIEKFIFHVTSGTSYHLSHPDLKIQEQIFRILAKENRTKRRMLAELIHDLIEKTPENMKTTRVLLPKKKDEPYYLFLLLPYPDFLSYERYREFRGDLLNRYLSITKRNYPEALEIIGLATETGFSDERSEDFAYLDAKIWSAEDNREAEILEKELHNIGMIGEKMGFKKTIQEYPDLTPKDKTVMKGKNRNMICPYCNSGKKYKKCCGADRG